MGWLNQLKKCFKEYGCWDKDGIAAAIQAGIAAQGEDGPTQQTIDAEIAGYIPAGADNGAQQSIFGYSTYDADTYGAVPTIGPVAGHNPQCDGPGNTIGTLVIDPLLPADSDGTFDITYTFIDNSGGGGGMFIFCPSTGETAQLQSAGGSFGNNTGPVTNTLSFDASVLNCPVEDVLVGINAWGVSSEYPDDRCDHLSGEVGTLTVVTPSQCAPAAECFKEIFGCSVAELAALSDGPLSQLQDKVNNLEFQVYRLSEPENGYKVDAWFDNDGKAYPHPAGLNTVAEVDALIDEIWSGPASADGIGEHVNGAPSQSVVISGSSNFNDAAANFPGGEGSGLDQYKLQTYIDTTGLGPIDLRDDNANSGEAGRIYLSQCCGNLQVAGHILDTPPYNAGTFATNLPEGIHCVTVLLSDRTAFGGFRLSFAAAGTEEFAFMDPARLYTEKRVIECDLIKGCDVIPQGWSLEQPKLCGVEPSVAGGGGDSLSEDEILALIGPHTELCTEEAVERPLAMITVSEAGHRRQYNGEDIEAARCDMVQEKPRIDPTPIEPVPTFTGTGEMSQNIILDRWSDENWVEYAWRARVLQDPGTGWGFIVLPNIAGFQRPIITVEGTYRSVSTAVQEDGSGNTNNQSTEGAGPRGPYMGQEAHHWSSTQRVYIGYFRRDNALNMFVDYRAKYVCL